MRVHTFWRTPVSRRAYAEILYVLVGTPLAVLGAGYAVACFALGAGLAVTAAGIPLLALALRGARGFGALHRALARVLLGERVGAPAPPRRARGLLGRLRSALADGAAWRAMAYLVVKLPLTVVQFYVVVLTWAAGAVALTYPIQYLLGLNESTTRDAHGVVRHGLTIGGMRIDSLPLTLVLSVYGLMLLLIAPWAVRAVVLADRLLIRRLLGANELTERVRDLEETRARAVDDAAATLRRIERDLHDGAQVRLIALTMQLTMVRDAVPDGPARELAISAQATAREAIAELRELVRGIHPPVLDNGLDAALATLATHSGVPVELRADIAARPTAAIESIAYFCAAELLANVAKHSGATRAWLSVTQSGDRLSLRVRDNGSGGAVPGAGSGLSGLLDRVGTVDGRLEIASPPGGPTAVTVELHLLAGSAAGVGYLLKERVADIDDFVDALRRVAAGGTALDPEVVAHLLNAGRQGVGALTPRERQVLGLMAEGRTNAAIVKTLVVTDRAVEKHIANIFTKLGLAPSGDDHRRVLAVLRFLGT